VKLKTSSFVIAVTFALTTILAPITGFADDAGKKAAIADLVRAMGYGCGIHNFKNYVLRGKEKHRNNAATCFADAKKAIANFRKASASETETGALQTIEEVVDAYNSSLVTIAAGVKAGKTAKQIDKLVKISDAPATNGIKALQNGHEWSASEQAEYVLGYGGAIHQFKNYVLRGDDRYQKAMDKFTAAETALAPIKDKPAAKDVLGVIGKYKAELDTVKKMVADGKTAEEIDATVKISDGPATKGLATLRGQ